MNDYNITNDLSSYKEVVPMLNKIFKTNFYKFLSKIYLHDEFLPNHYIVRDNGKIVANVASLPITLKCGESTLSCRGIGMVAVLDSMRGKGLMDKLMTHACNKAKEEGVDFMFLGGNRKRYERYGFVPCGVGAEFHIIKENIAHSKTDVVLDFVKIKSNSPLLPKISAIYNSQKCHYIRNDFYEVVSSWHTKTHYAIMNKGEVAGHISIKNRSIVDISMRDIDICDVIINYFNKMLKLPFLKVFIYGNQPEYIKSLSTLAQSISYNTTESLHVINYRNVVDKLLSLQTASFDFSVVIEIESVDKFLVSATSGVYSVQSTTAQADVVLPKAEATQALFSPHLAQIYRLPFTLNLFINHLDNV